MPYCPKLPAWLPAAAMLLLVLPAAAEEFAADSSEEYSPAISAASDEGERAIPRIRLPEGFSARLFAAEPLLANPVAFHVDERGRVYVAETFRHTDGVTDNRSHMVWLDDDLACRTVEDRVAMYRKHLGEKIADYAREHDRLRLIEDTDGDGRADRASVFADGFHNPADGIASGVLARGGDVFFACIPDLWLLRDADGDGRAEDRRVLHHGYGVHVAFIGHDLHGLRMGPDGRLYFSIGDRGLHVETAGRTVSAPDCGAVLRCNPDGSELEVFAYGLRNPQELAFDEYGNLFTGDNNSDSGDQARWVQVVEGGDSGWRIGFQYLEQPYSRGPWNAEKMWHPTNDEQPAYIVPPLANIASGPSGLTYYPGTGMPERYRGHFFLCDFRGDSGRSGIHTFALRPSGATFEVVDREEFLWSLLVTDCDFAPDGGLYVSDWVEGWAKPTKGRIYRVTHEQASQQPVVAEVKRLLGEGMRDRSPDELAALLAHADMRVRQEAQFALAARGSAAVEAFAAVAGGSESQLARIHALWGLGQIARALPEAAAPVVAQLSDGDAEVRAQAAKVAGECRAEDAYEPLLALLGDDAPRVRFFAALSLGKLGRPEAVPQVLEMLRDNADHDRYLRHAGVMALTALADREALLAAATDGSPAARRGVLLALRRQSSPDVARFLDDPDMTIAAEAARAIHDEPIADALPHLAALAGRQGLPETLHWRALCANFRLGGAANAAAVASVAARADVPEIMRIEALRQLAEWQKPSGRDRVTGLWRPMAPREEGIAADALRNHLPGIFAGPDAVRQEAARIAGELGIDEVGPLLFELAAGRQNSASSRVAALGALEALADARLPDAVSLALADDDARVRAAGRRLRAKADPEAGIALLERALSDGETIERQQAFSTLAGLDHPRAAELLAASLDRLLDGDVPPELRLDLLSAAAMRSEPAVAEQVARYEAARPQDDPLRDYRETLVGGDGERGARVFFDRAEVSCLRCHKVRGRGGDVGPDLTTIAARKDREYLLRSLVQPDTDIAQGFETVVVEMDDGLVHTGILREETADELRLMTPEGKPFSLPKSEVVDRARGKSAMPDTVMKNLTKAELRDVVEFLAGLRE